MKVYDTRVPIHETADSLPSIHDLIEKLGEMLGQYNISYCFSLPSAQEQEQDKNLCYWLHSLSEQNTELTLVVSLFCRLYLKKDTQKILESIVKSFGRHIA
jgi:hypothetical protein